jgi:hypothetical protein
MMQPKQNGTINIAQLYTMIGQLTVENQTLRAQIAAMRPAALEPPPKPVAKGKAT